MSDRDRALEAWKAKYSVTPVQKVSAPAQAAPAADNSGALTAWKEKHAVQTTKQPGTQIASPASGIGDYNSAMERLKEQRRQAAITQDDAAAKRVYDAMKALRAAHGKQTFGDRLVDMGAAAFGGSGSALVNTAGTGLGLFNEAMDAFEGDEKKFARMKAEETAEALRTGRLSDGRPVTAAMRPTLEAMLAEYQAKYEAAEVKKPFKERHAGLAAAEQKLYDAADSMSEAAAGSTKSAKAGLGAAGQFAVDAGIGAMQMGADIAAGAATGGGAMLPMALRVFGGGAQEARHAGADIGQQVAYGAGSAAVSLLTEKIANVAGPFKSAFGKGVLDDALTKITAKPGGKLILSALSEGGEEMLESVMQPLLQKATYAPEAAYDSEWLAETLYSGAIGAVLGAAGGGVDAVGSMGKGRNSAVVQDPEWAQTLESIAPEKHDAFTQAKLIAERFGTQLNVSPLANGAAGEYLSGVVTIDPDAENPVRQVLVHELTHHMETSGLYGEFSGKVMDFIARDMGVDVEALKQDIVRNYGERGVELDSDGAARELVAKFAEDKLFQDERTIQRLLQTDRNLFQKIYDWIRDTVAKLQGTGEEKFLIDAQNLYEKALRQAGGQNGIDMAQNTFAGVNARTADLNALTVAQQMEGQGINADTIRKQTGWYRGMDGKWRFEIDDSGMKYFRRGDVYLQNHPEYAAYQNLMDKMLYGTLTEEDHSRLRELDAIWSGEPARLSKRIEQGNARLRDILQHDALFEAYPRLRSVRVEFGELEPGTRGSFDPGARVITLSNALKNAPQDTLIHEVQHAIQEIEGFTGGSNPEFWDEMLKGNHPIRTKGYEDAQEKLRKFVMAPENAEVPNLDRMLENAETDEDYDAIYAAAEQQGLAHRLAEYRNLMWEAEAQRGRGERMVPSELYRNTAGEIEARDAAARRAWTPEQRELKMPTLGDANTVFAEGGRLSEQAIGRTTSGKPFVLVEDDILAGIPQTDWVKTVKQNLAKKFPNGITVGKNDIAINKDSRREMTFSKYMQKMFNKNPQIYEDKLRATDNSDEILLATTAWVNEGPKHHRKDDIKDFARGHVLLRVGNNDYTAEVVVGTKGNGSMLLYDIVNLTPTTITEKSQAQDYTANVTNGLRSRTLAPDAYSIFGKYPNVNNSYDITPKLTRHDEGQNSMGPSFTELVQNQRDGVRLGAGGQMVMRGTEPVDITPKLEAVAKPSAEAPVQSGGYDTAGYMDALAKDENDLTDPVTPADRIYDSKLRRLQNEEAPPEPERRASISKRDLDELVELYRDVANPVDTARSARFEASEGLIRASTEKERKSTRQHAADAKSYFLRKMVDAGDSVTRLAKTVKDEYLYPFYNMARASASAGINMIQSEQTDITGKRVGESLNDIFTPIREKGDTYYNQFQTYLYDLHNIDRMTLVTGENTAKLDAEMALRDFDKENPDVATLTEARLQRKAQSIDEEEVALAKERIRLLRKLNQADRMGNKPVFGWDVTADMSRERSDRLLREHPEFAAYREQVRGYIRNLMQYRVDSGLMTAEDAAFLEKYYPNYVPTFRVTDKGVSTRDKKSVKVGKTVGLAEGGNQKIVPLHEALGKQTMQVVREGSKNRFGARLLEDYATHSKDPNVQKYVLDAKEYESDFSTETFDEPEIELKKDNTFTVYRNGKKYEMTVDPSMFEAVKALYPDAQESNTLVKFIRASNNLFKSLVTGYNPTFTIRNTVRDLQTAGLYSRDAKAFAQNYPLALQEIAKDGEFWKQYKALGGSFSSVFDYQTGTVQEPDGKVARMAAKIETLNMAMEQAPRLAEFMSVVKAGDGSMENLMDAMHAAADVTVNFGRAGTLGKLLNANFVPFLNPGIQGFDKMVRRVTETKGAKEWAKLAVRAGMLGVLPSVLNSLLYSDDEDWADLKDRDKDANYLFKIGDGIWLKIPKGRELSILGMAADRIGDVARGEEVNWRDFITTVGNQVAPANPLRQNILAAWFDTDLFNASSPGRAWYGGDIESQRLRGYAPGQRYDSSTDIFSKWVGQQLNLSPKKINYLLDQYTGVVGDFVLPLLTPQAERDMFTKAFTVDSVASNDLSAQFYDTSDQLTYAKNGGDATSKVLSRFWTKQQTACADIYAQIREIESSDLPNREKKQQVREARVILNGIQKNALAVLDTYQATVEKHLHGTSDDAVDEAYREANRECFGAEYALEVYNKDTYAKAVQAHENGVSYEDFYTYYFDTKDYESSSWKSANTKKMEYLKAAGFDTKTQAELYFANLASDSDLKKQTELENSAGISAEDYWEYKVAISGMTKKTEKMVAIDGLDLTANQKTALYYSNGWAESTLDEAPWISGRSSGLVMPKLTAAGTPFLKQQNGNAAGNPFLGKQGGLIMPKLIK